VDLLRILVVSRQRSGQRLGGGTLFCS